MYRPIKRCLQAAVRFYDHWRGKRDLRLVAINNSSHEVYRFTTTNNGEVIIYCTETIYEVSYSAWWANSRKHYTYHVYGQCSKEIPEVLSTKLRDGFHIGKLLPVYAARKDQKKAAIHGFVSLILQDLQEQF